MIRTPIAGLRGHVGETVTIAGWAQALRLQRAMQFIIVRDHTGTAQVTHRRDGGALEAALDGLTTESAIRVTGRVKANPVVSLGGLELLPDELVVESAAQAPLPVDSRTGPEGRSTGGSSTSGGGPPPASCSRCRPRRSGRCASSPTPRAARRCTPPS